MNLHHLLSRKNKRRTERYQWGFSTSFKGTTANNLILLQKKKKKLWQKLIYKAPPKIEYFEILKLVMFFIFNKYDKFVKLYISCNSNSSYISSDGIKGVHRITPLLRQRPFAAENFLKAVNLRSFGESFWFNGSTAGTPSQPQAGHDTELTPAPPLLEAAVKFLHFLSSWCG